MYLAVITPTYNRHHLKTAHFECLKGNYSLFTFSLIYSTACFPEMPTRKVVCGISEVHSRMLLRTSVSRDTCKMIRKKNFHISYVFKFLFFYMKCMNEFMPYILLAISVYKACSGSLLFTNEILFFCLLRLHLEFLYSSLILKFRSILFNNTGVT